MKQDQSVQNRAALAPYKTAITRYIRSAMALRNKRYEDLVADLSRSGIHLNAENLRSKVSKGMFSADLLAAIIEILGVEENALTEILKLVSEGKSENKNYGNS